MSNADITVQFRGQFEQMLAGLAASNKGFQELKAEVAANQKQVAAMEAHFGKALSESAATTKQVREESKARREAAQAAKDQAAAEREAAKVNQQNLALAERSLKLAEERRQLRLSEIFKSSEGDVNAALDRRAVLNSQRMRELEAKGIDEADAGKGRMDTLAGLATVGVALKGFSEAITAATQVTIAMRNANNQAGMAAEASAKALTDFEQMNVGMGAAGRQLVVDTVKIGAAAGIGASDIATMANPIESSVAKDANGNPTAEGIAQFKSGMAVSSGLVNMGAAAQDAGLIIAQGIEKGIDPRRMGSLFQTAATESKLTTAQMAAAAPGANFFSSAEAGYAAITALSTMESPDRIRESAEAFQRAVGPGAVDSKFVKKFGLKGLSEEEAVNKLQDYALSHNQVRDGEDQAAYTARALKEFADSLGKYGLEIREARAVGIMVQKGDTFRGTLDKFDAMPQGADVVSERWAQTRAMFPGLESDYQGRVTAAQLQYEQQFGKGAAGNLAERRIRRDEGAVYAAAGRKDLQNQQTGEGMAPETVKPLGWLPFIGDYTPEISTRGVNAAAFSAGDFIHRLRGGKRRDNPFTSDIEGEALPGGQTARQAAAGGGDIGQKIDTLSANMERLNQTLEQNNAATHENTKASSGGDSSGFSVPVVSRNGNG